MTENTIIKQLYRFFANHDYRLHNAFMYQWECDFFCISSSGYAVEVEVKISKSDFKADFKKTQKHKLLSNASKQLVCIPGQNSKYIQEDGRWKISDYQSTSVTFVKPVTPNRFYYCCPEGMINKTEIPDYAGLLYYTEKYDEKRNWSSAEIKEVKTSKFLHKTKHDYTRALLEKFYYLSIDQKYEISQLRRKLNELNRFYVHPDYFDDDIHKSKTIITPTIYEQDLFIDQKL